MAELETPNRIFKLCVADESAKFHASGHIRSTLDAADGFIHLSGKGQCVHVVASTLLN